MDYGFEPSRRKDRFEHGVVAQARFSTIVEVLAAPRPEGRRGEDVVEASREPLVLALEHPAGCFALVSVERPKDIGQVVRL